MQKQGAGEDKLRSTNQKSEVALREEEVLKFWQEHDIFKKSLEKKAPLGEFVFYEGPPTANGRPGIHHLESRAFKDAIPRYKTMRGYHVRRKAGWDTHGLPVELEVEKELGIKNKKDIERYGIAEFNKKCKESVLRYIDEWKIFTDRIAFWVDHSDTYFTFDNSYIESVWAILKHAHSRKLLYKDYKVIPWCPRCGTGLSSHEVAQGYAEVKDPSVYVKFKLTDADEYFLVWTTTPWTLPSNMALAVGEDVDYIKVASAGTTLWLAKERAGVVEGASILAEAKGKELVGRTYEPLFPFLKDKTGKAFGVYAAEFVSTKECTGIVHMAPMYGADDFELGNTIGLPKHHLVKPDGKFSSEAGPFAELFVKKADAQIIEDLKTRELLFKEETVEHTYPFCWRCKTPLLYYATDSWYLRMSKLKNVLIKENNTIHWEPEHIKLGRFGEWLRELKDWAISRARFWGTPLPIWECEKCKRFEVIGSVSELEGKVGEVPDDLHRPFVDQLTFLCACGGTMRRVPEVLDVWFDSGAMPFAQDHYPFENKRWVEGEGYPADYICEAIDQTRGWFYTLHAVGALMGRGKAYRSVVCLGHILDARGKKMSKSQGNIVEPFPMIDKYGVDALRYFMYTVNAPGDSKNFDERTVDEIVKKNFNRLHNVLSFYELYANDAARSAESPNLLDRWILTRLEELVGEATDGFEAYKLDAAIRPVGEFIDDLSNWYVRRSRDRFKTEGADKLSALTTLRYVLFTLSCIMAPSTPFFAEYLYRGVREAGDPESVHLTAWPGSPATKTSLLDLFFNKAMPKLDAGLLRGMREARSLASQALKARERAGIKIRQPLGTLKIKISLTNDLARILAEEVNVKRIVEDPTLQDDIELDTTLTSELKDEGILRDLVRAIQEWRKDQGFRVTDRPGLLVVVSEHAPLFKQHREEIVAQTGLLSLEVKEVAGNGARTFERL